MTTTSPAPTPAPTSAPPRSRRRIVAGVVALLVVGLALGGVRAVSWWTHPDVLESAYGGFRATPRPVDRAVVTVTVAFPPLQGDGAVVTLHDLRAHLSVNTAGTNVTFSTCRTSEPFVAVYGTASQTCAEATPVTDGTVLHWTPGSDETLVVTLTPTRPGRVVLDRVDADVALGRSHLWQHGTQALEMAVELRVL